MISLILCTMGRTWEVSRFLKALDASTCRDIELLIVDQNPPGYLNQVLLDAPEWATVKYLRSLPGLSKARNVGLQAASGDIIAFPDDDCWYTEVTLEVVNKLFKAKKTDGICGRSIDKDGIDSQGKWPIRETQIVAANAWFSAISYTIFLRRSCVAQVGAFDETLGVGAGTLTGSGEETDYLLRALRCGSVITYSPEVIVHHPQPSSAANSSMKKAFSYGCGCGYVLAKNRASFRLSAYMLLRPLYGILQGVFHLSWQEIGTQTVRFAGRVLGAAIYVKHATFLTSHPDNVRKA